MFYLTKFIQISICLTLLFKQNNQILASNIFWSHDTTWQRSYGLAPICVDIPVNMSLCHGIGYTKMRLPNLLQHDSLQEVSQQAVSWIPLLNLGCHPDTQLFLCSLFTPVCLDHPIPPCRSLCLSVKSSCERMMNTYGYGWPNIVRCEQFPIDNDMCIQAQSDKKRDRHLSSPSSSTSSVLSSSTTSLMEVKRKQNRKKQKINKQKRRNEYRNSNIDENDDSNNNNNNNSKDDRNDETRDEKVVKNMNKNERVIVNSKTDDKRTINNNENEKKRAKNEEDDHEWRQLMNKYCLSEWIIKAKGTHIKRNHTSLFKLRNIQILAGNFTDIEKPVINLNAEQAEIFIQNPNRPRYFIMGNKLDATYIATWIPGKTKLRRALKVIRSGKLKCNQKAINTFKETQNKFQSQQSGQPQPTGQQNNNEKQKKRTKNRHNRKQDINNDQIIST